MTTNGSLSDSLASTDGHRTPNVELLSKTNLYIKGLQPATTDQDLYEMCKRYGQISSTKAILDKATGSCRGYGFVEFTTPHFAEIAVQELIKSGIQAQMARISSVYPSHRHNQHHNQHHHHNNNNNNHHSSNHHNNGNNHNNIGSGGGGASGHSSSNSGYNNNNNSHQHNQNSLNNSNPDPTNLYIANLPPNMSEQELENLLSNYGPVVSTRILRDQLSDISRGVGFARMESRDKCEKIIEQLNGRPYKDFKEPLLVKFADSGNRKRHHNNQQQHLNNNHHLHHKNHQDDNRWRESGNQVDVGGVPNFEHQSNISHSNHLSDLAMMSTMSYPRIPGFPPAMAAGAAYPTPQGSNAGAAYQAPLGPNPGAAYPASLGPNTGAPQWIPGPPGQPYVIPQQLIQAGGLDPSNPAAAAAAAALHYGHIPQLAYSPGYLGTYFVGPSARQSPQ